MQTYREYTTLRRLHPDHAEKRYGSEDESGGVVLWAIAVLALLWFATGLLLWWPA